MGGPMGGGMPGMRPGGPGLFRAGAQVGGSMEQTTPHQGAHQGGLQSLSKELLQELMHDEAKLQQFLAENPSMMEEIMALL